MGLRFVSMTGVLKLCNIESSNVMDYRLCLCSLLPMHQSTTCLHVATQLALQHPACNSCKSSAQDDNAHLQKMLQILQRKDAECVQTHSPPAVAVACVAVAATAVESPSCSCQTAWPSVPRARHAAAASVAQTACLASAAAAAVDIAAAAAGSSAQCKHRFRMMPAEQHLLGVPKA